MKLGFDEMQVLFAHEPGKTISVDIVVAAEHPAAPVSLL